MYIPYMISCDVAPARTITAATPVHCTCAAELVVLVGVELVVMVGVVNVSDAHGPVATR